MDHPAADATVLVVEDQADVRRFAMTILRLKGYRLLEAENPEAALALCEKYAGPIDLLVTDVVMPGMSGRDLAELLLRQRPTLKVLFVSGYTGDAVGREKFLEPGAEFLPKPFTPDQLSAKIRQILNSPRAAHDSGDR